MKKTDYGHSEVMANFSGKDPREYCISTKRFVTEDGKLKGLDTVRVEWTQNGGAWKMEEVKGSEKVSPEQASKATSRLLWAKQSRFRCMMMLRNSC